MLARSLSLGRCVAVPCVHRGSMSLSLVLSVRGILVFQIGREHLLEAAAIRKHALSSFWGRISVDT